MTNQENILIMLGEEVLKVAAEDASDSPLTLSLTLDEFWAIHKYVRRPREQEGQEFGKDFMLGVYRGIIALEALPRDHQATTTRDLPCEVGDLWQITRLVDMEYCRGGKYTGYSLLTKAMRLLAAPIDDATPVVKLAEGILTEIGETEIAETATGSPRTAPDASKSDSDSGNDNDLSIIPWPIANAS